jgi:hypothetical protein
MSEYMFGCGGGSKLTVKEIKRRKAAAEKNDAVFVYGEDPGKEDGWGNQLYRWWFACQNRGEPFDGRTQRDVEAELALSKK